MTSFIEAKIWHTNINIRNAPYLGGSERRAVLYASKAEWNHLLGQLRTTTQQTKARDCWKTPAVYDTNFPLWQHSASYCKAGEKLFEKQRLGSYVSPTAELVHTLPLFANSYSGRCQMPFLEYGSHQNSVLK